MPGPLTGYMHIIKEGSTFPGVLQLLEVAWDQNTSGPIRAAGCPYLHHKNAFCEISKYVYN